MATAAELFATEHEPHKLVSAAAQLLAAEPGAMCLISLATGPLHTLQPVALAHAHPSPLQRMGEQLRRGVRLQPDAFSREVQKTRGTLRMRVSNPRLLRLWFPSEYALYAERVGVGALLATALICRRRVVGTLLLWRERGQRAFSDSDEAYVAALADRLALALVPARA
jgi:GAF domain-containing protein